MGLFSLTMNGSLTFPFRQVLFAGVCLHYFYTRHWGCLGGTEDEFLGKFGLSRELQAVYERLEQSFQAYVHGDGEPGIFS